MKGFLSMPSDRKVPNEVVLNIATECLTTVPIMGSEGFGPDEYSMQNLSWMIADPVFATQLLLFTLKCNNEDEVRDRVMILLANSFSRSNAVYTMGRAKLVIDKLVMGALSRIPENPGGG